MSLFIIDTDTCTRCGACISVCPTNIIAFGDDGFPAPKSGKEERCISCGHCVAVCPSASFSHEAMPVESCQPVETDLFPRPDGLEHLMRSRRSIRHYSPEPVDRETLGGIIESVCYAPSGHNSRSLEWVVVYDSEKVKRVAEITIDWMRRITKEGKPLARILNFERIVAIWESGEDMICRSAPQLIAVHAPKENAIASIDSTIALGWLDLAAAAHDLGTCWAGFVMICSMHDPRIAKELGIPDDRALTGAMMIGKSKHSYHRIPVRTAGIAWL